MFCLLYSDQLSLKPCELKKKKKKKKKISKFSQNIYTAKQNLINYAGGKVLMDSQNVDLPCSGWKWK